jgi:hypothetical protein
MADDATGIPPTGECQDPPSDTHCCPRIRMNLSDHESLVVIVGNGDPEL